MMTVAEFENELAKRAQELFVVPPDYEIRNTAGDEPLAAFDFGRDPSTVLP